MAWDASKPSNTGIVSAEVSNLRDNWDYIETVIEADHRFNAGGDPVVGTDGYHKRVNLPDVGEGNDPTVKLDGVVYSKTDGTNVELFYRNASATIQLTKNSTAFGGAAAYCQFDGSDASPITVNNSLNITNVTKSATGTYVVNIAAGALSTTNYVASITIEGTSASPFWVRIGTRTTTTLPFDVFRINNLASSPTTAKTDSEDISIVIYEA